MSPPIRNDAVTSLARSTLILGGARSGKSLFAENMFEQYEQKTYLATALARDNEMKKRIQIHQARRNSKWKTVEESIDIANVISSHSKKNCPILIDCLTFWAMNLLSNGCNHKKEVKRLLDTLQESAGPVVLVSNEIGLGVIPENELSRRFVDLQGEINQAVAQASDCVILVAAGLPIMMKPNE
ncbi:MAG: bifunctional adenosylcobinamide kinase/adenosylcobinamide-phosphate guanylyltransferase [Magnetovibrio sp.]|nr:bifunctional adenosylcobinamide kinase/adenosylcobinamide-phosphate guanylyltransferase [Magnetovibrio sp.]